MRITILNLFVFLLSALVLLGNISCKKLLSESAKEVVEKVGKKKGKIKKKGPRVANGKKRNPYSKHSKKLQAGQAVLLGGGAYLVTDALLSAAFSEAISTKPEQPTIINDSPTDIMVQVFTGDNWYTQRIDGGDQVKVKSSAGIVGLKDQVNTFQIEDSGYYSISPNEDGAISLVSE